MNTETAKRRAIVEILNAAADGKSIRYARCQSVDVFDPNYRNILFQYPQNFCIAPEPKTRPWSKPEDVPGPVCWIRSDIGDKDIELVIGLNRNYVTVGNAIMGGTRQIPWKDFPRDATWEYSTDRKTWHKCEVTEEAQ